MTVFAIHNSEYEPIINNWPINISIPDIECLEGVNSNIQQQIDTKLSSVSLNDITDWPMAITSTEVGYLDNVTSSIQNQLDAKPNSDTTGIAGADIVTNIISLSQADYDAIITPSSSTVYIIT